MTMDETIQRSIDRNFERILHDGRGAAYVGHEDWLREGLALMAKNELGKGCCLLPNCFVFLSNPML